MNANWTIKLEKIESKVRVGIYAHEREPQRIWVSAELEGTGPVQPKHIDECINYEPVYNRVTQLWPNRPQTELLETLVVDLLQAIFGEMPQVTKARVQVTKPDIFAQAEAVSVELAWSRDDYEKAKKAGVI